MLMDEIKLKIYSMEDRLAVASVLVKNGYTVRQTKEKRPSGRACDYFLVAVKDKGNAEVSR